MKARQATDDEIMLFAAEKLAGSMESVCEKILLSKFLMVQMSCRYHFELNNPMLVVRKIIEAFVTLEMRCLPDLVVIYSLNQIGPEDLQEVLRRIPYHYLVKCEDGGEDCPGFHILNVEAYLKVVGNKRPVRSRIATIQHEDLRLEIGQGDYKNTFEFAMIAPDAFLSYITQGIDPRRWPVFPG